MKRRRRKSLFTIRRDGNKIIIVDHGIVVNEMGELLPKEFVCYGFEKTAKQLNMYGNILNKKMSGISWVRVAFSTIHTIKECW
ncbi:MAG: hypothetical protein QXU18_07330 [Thermoplasmatales archaeon]